MSSVFTGWDGTASDRAPWHVDVVRIDPRAFKGRLAASYGPDVYHRETTSALAGPRTPRSASTPASSSSTRRPGSPAGAGVYGGRVLSEPTNGRPPLVLRSDGDGGVDRLRWAGRARVDGRG